VASFGCDLRRLSSTSQSLEMTESLFSAGGSSFDETVEAASDAVDGSELPSNVRRMGDEDAPTSLEAVVAIKLLVCIDVAAVLAGLIPVLVLAHGVDEKMPCYYAVSNMSMLFCCAMIVLLWKSGSEERVPLKGGRGPRILSIVIYEKVPYAQRRASKDRTGASGKGYVLFVRSRCLPRVGARPCPWIRQSRSGKE
jgi:hypothetical protein